MNFYNKFCNYFDGWITIINVKTFQDLRDLMIENEVKKRAPLEFKEFHLNDWTNIISSLTFREKLAEFKDEKKYCKTEVLKYLSEV